MAIIIPSKSIYEKNNPKIRDNNIKKVEVGNVQNSLEKDLNKQVYEMPMTTVEGETPTIVEKAMGHWIKSNSEVAMYNLFASSYTKIEYTYSYSQGIHIPKKLPNGYVSDLKVGKDNEGNNNIKQSISYELKTEQIEIPFTASDWGDFLLKGNPQSLFDYATMGSIKVLSSNTSRVEMLPTEYFSQEKDVTLNIENNFSVSSLGHSAKANSTINQTYNDNVSKVLLDGTKTNSNFRLSQQLKTLYGLTVTKATYGNTDFNVKDGEKITLKGTRETYTPLEGKFTFYGDIVTLKSEDSTEILGDANSKQVISFDGNELMQKRIPFYTEKCYLSTTGELKYSNQFYCTKDLVKVNVGETYKVDIYNFSSGTTVHSACVFDEKKNFLAFIRYSDGFKIDVENAYYIGINFINTNGTSELNGNEYYEVNGQIFSVVDNYNKIIRSYQNGKETATIRCSIVDYYDENGELVVSPSKSYLYDYTQHATNGNAYVQMDEFGYVLIPTTAEIQSRVMYANFNKVVKVDLPYGEYEFSISDMSSDISGFVQLDHSTEFSNIEEEYYRISFAKSEPKTVKFNVNSIRETFYLHLEVLLTDTRKTFKVEINGKKTKMLFEQYDEVIPMVIDKNSKDNPMSFYKDGNPKKFKVLSVRPYFDGAVWQELSLQEIDN